MGTSRKAVLVTGAAGDIGRALCTAFSAAGYFVIATDLEQRAGETAGDVFIGADLAELVLDDNCREQFAVQVNAALSGRPLKGLVNNAAMQKRARLDDMAPADFRRTLDVNVTAPALLVQLFAGRLEEARGSVVNIGSIHARLTKPAFVAYATSKAALAGLTRALAVDLGDRVRVNAIQPAAVETAMLLEGFRGKRDIYPALEASHPVNRLARPDEIAAAGVFLVADDCRFMTGAVLDVDGGIGARLHDPE
jgi:NAD(P)-dependent dehydrogenase (short-subunit alcohol dehydrogenase family)